MQKIIFFLVLQWNLYHTAFSQYTFLLFSPQVEVGTGNIVTAIVPYYNAPHNGFMIGTNQGLCTVNATLDTWNTNLAWNDSIGKITSLCRWNNDSCVVGSLDAGFFIGSIALQSGFANYQTSNSNLVGNYIRSISVDSAKRTIYLGTPSGLSVFNFSTFKNKTTSNSIFISNHVKTLYKKDSILYIGFINGGLARMKNDSIYSIWILQNSTILDNSITQIVPYNNSLYITTPGSGFQKINNLPGNIVNTFNSNLPTNNLQHAIATYDGKLWFGTDNSGLIAWDGNLFEMIDTSNSNLPSNTILSLNAGHQKLLCGIAGGKLAVLDVENLKEDKTKPLQVKIYPNPASNVLHINNLQPESMVQIKDRNGKICFLKKANAENMQLTVSNLKTGLYIIEIRTNTHKKYFKWIKI